MAKVLLDTDVLIDHLRGDRRLQVNLDLAAYSSLTRAELYSGRDAAEPAIDELLGAMEEVPVDRRIAENAGRLRRRGTISLADAVIAATALAGGMQLMTRNLRHFRQVPKLQLHSRR